MKATEMLKRLFPEGGYELFLAKQQRASLFLSANKAREGIDWLEETINDIKG